jgi:N-acetyl-anhydromuramyl-L-alanine amidase AmpD
MNTLHKLGPHIQRPTPAAVRWAAKAWVVKSMDDVGPLTAARPGAITIYRKYFPYQDVMRNGAEVAAEIWNALGGFRPTYVELYNECCQGFNEGLRDYVRFTSEAVTFFHQHFQKVLGNCGSVGRPEREEILFWQSHGWAGVDAFGIHEYRANQGWSEWRGLRHRKMHEWTGGNHPPFIISECGRDRVVEEGAKGRGWREQEISAEDYLGELVEFDAEIQKDDYVLGATVFTAGPYDDWRDFDVDEFADLVRYEDKAPWSVVVSKPPQGGGETVSTFRIGNLDVNDLRTALSTHPTARYAARGLGQIDTIVVHHTASGELRSEDIANYHVNTLGWPGIGYHFVVHQNGAIDYTNSIDVVSYGVARHNDNTLHIALTGNFTAAPPGGAQLEAAMKLIANLRFALGRVYPVVGHKDIAPSDYATACPGATWPAWKQYIDPHLDPAPVTCPECEKLRRDIEGWAAKCADLTAQLKTANSRIAAARQALG